MASMEKNTSKCYIETVKTTFLKKGEFLPKSIPWYKTEPQAPDYDRFMLRWPDFQKATHRGCHGLKQTQGGQSIPEIQSLVPSPVRPFSLPHVLLAFPHGPTVIYWAHFWYWLIPVSHLQIKACQGPCPLWLPLSLLHRDSVGARYYDRATSCCCCQYRDQTNALPLVQPWLTNRAESASITDLTLGNRGGQRKGQTSPQRTFSRRYLWGARVKCMTPYLKVRK